MDDNNPVTRPAHYRQGGIEVIDIIRAYTADLRGFKAFCVGNIIKYILRAANKNGEEDYEKAFWYLVRLIGVDKASSLLYDIKKQSKSVDEDPSMFSPIYQHIEYNRIKKETAMTDDRTITVNFDSVKDKNKWETMVGIKTTPLMFGIPNQADSVHIPSSAIQVAFDEYKCIAAMAVSPKKVYYRNPYTIVIWEDGTKTIVKCSGKMCGGKAIKYDKLTGFLLCCLKKGMNCSNNKYHNFLKKWGAYDD